MSGINKSQDIKLEELKTKLDTLSGHVDGLEGNTRGMNGDTGDQIIKSGGIGAGTTPVVIHTVTAGKTLFLTSVKLEIHGSTTGIGYMKVTNAADVDVYLITTKIAANAQGYIEGFKAFPKPLKIPAGYKIKTVGSSATCDSHQGDITGWEE